MKIYESEEKFIAVEYFSRLSDTVGAVGIGVCFTLLQFENPTKAASLSALVFFLWSVALGSRFRHMLRTSNFKASATMFLQYGWLGYFSLCFMFFIAIGVVKVDWFR